MHEDGGAAEPGRDVRYAARQVHRNAGLACKRLEPPSLAPLPEHHELGVVVPAQPPERAHGDVDAFLPLESADRKHDRRVGRNVVRRIAPPCLRGRVESVVNRRQLACGQPDAVDLKPG